MHHSIKRLAQGTFVYGLSNIIVRVCSYLLILFQTRILSPSSYSIVIEFCGSYISLGHAIYMLAMDMAYVRFVPQLKQKDAFNTVVTILFISSVVCSIGLFLGAPKLSQFTKHPAHLHYFYYMAPILSLDTFSALAYAHLRVKQQYLRYMFVKCAQACSNISVAFVLLYYPSALVYIGNTFKYMFGTTVQLTTLDAVFMANVLSSAITFFALLPNFKGVRFLWKHKLFYMFFSYALPSFCVLFFLRCNSFLPLVLFRRLAPVHLYGMNTKEMVLGSFGAASKVALCLSFVIQAFKAAAEPFFVTHFQNKNSNEIYIQVMHLFVFFACFALWIFSLNIYWVSKILIPNALYRYTIHVAPYLAFVHVLLGIYYNLGILFRLSGSIRHDTWVSGLGSLVVLGMSLLCIPKYGYWGCIYASMSGATGMTLLAYYIAQKRYPIPYAKQLFLLLGLTFLVLGYIPCWPEKLACFPLSTAYILLNVAIVCLFYLIGLFMFPRFSAEFHK